MGGGFKEWVRYGRYRNGFSSGAFWIHYFLLASACFLLRAPFEPADCGRVDDGQTNSINFETICLAVERRTEPADR